MGAIHFLTIERKSTITFSALSLAPLIIKFLKNSQKTCLHIDSTIKLFSNIIYPQVTHTVMFYKTLQHAYTMFTHLYDYGPMCVKNTIHRWSTPLSMKHLSISTN